MEVPAGTYSSQIAKGFTRMRGRSEAGCFVHQLKDSAVPLRVLLGPAKGARWCFTGRLQKTSLLENEDIYAVILRCFWRTSACAFQ